MTRVGIGLVALLLAAPVQEPSRVDAWGDPLPEGAIARLGSMRFQHASQVDDLQYSGDGRKIFSSGWGSIRVWDASSGRMLLKILGGQGELETMAVSPDGRTICATGCNTVQIGVWDGVTGQRRFTLKGYGDNPNFTGGGKASLAVSGDGRRLASLIRDAQLRVWDLEKGREIFKRSTLAGEKFAYSSGVALNPDGSLVACVVGKTTVVLSTETGRTVLRIDEAGLGPAKFSKDGKRIACSSKEQGIRIWDLDAAKELHAVEARVGWGRAFDWSPDEKFVAWAEYPSGLRIADVQSGKVLHKFDGLVANTFAFSPDSRNLAVGFQFTILQFDVATGREVSEGRRHAASPGGVAWAFSPDSRMVASASMQTPIYFWNPRTGEELFRIESPGKKLALGFSEEGRVLLVFEVQWAQSSTVRRFDLVTGRQLSAFDIDVKNLGSNASRFSPGARFLGLALHQGLKLIDSRTGQVIREIPTGGYSYGWAASADGSRLAVGGGKLSVFETATWQELWSEPSDGKGSYDSFQYMPDGREVAVNATNRIRFLDSASGKQVREVPLVLKDNPYARLASVTPDGQTIALQVWDPGAVHLVDVRKSRVHRSLPMTESSWSTQISPDGSLVGVLAADATITIWPLTTPSTPGGVEAPTLPSLWDRLGAPSIRDARTAVIEMAGMGAEVVPWLRDRLKGRLAGSPPPDEKWRKLIADLDSEDISVRERAVGDLQKSGAAAEPALILANESSKSALATTEIRKLLDEIASTPVPPGDMSRFVLSLRVLDQIGTVDAALLLEELRTKAPTVVERREASAALDRLKARKKD